MYGKNAGPPMAILLPYCVIGISTLGAHGLLLLSVSIEYGEEVREGNKSEVDIILGGILGCSHA